MGQISRKSTVMKKQKPIDNYQSIVKNKKASFNYTIGETLEAGIALLGTEVKSLRIHKASIGGVHISIVKNQAVIINLNISEYQSSKHNNHKPNRKRILLLHKKQINKLKGLQKLQGITLVPLSIYFNNKGIVKVSIAIAKGKKIHDKREAAKRKEVAIELKRAVKHTS
ncbi:SsrA-binding protein [Candidatus Xenohaliotis californiensis]|uniref:SsrA-binding protein n=1 Tax=Candidatus Xenohaliotis californiensis TaxID=84677 RepID=A0ABM9N8P9_9RICK|nr:SsrA-binding protein [Candidatus Xenohaliotis californiensis]